MGGILDNLALWYLFKPLLRTALIQCKLGFKNFVVGRDHAGAFGNYKSLDAYRLVSKFKKKLKINIITLKGAYFCQDCKKISNNICYMIYYFSMVLLLYIIVSYNLYIMCTL